MKACCIAISLWFLIWFGSIESALAGERAEALSQTWRAEVSLRLRTAMVAHRKDNPLTWGELGAQVGLSNASFTGFQNGQLAMTLEDSFRIADVLNVDYSWLLALDVIREQTQSMSDAELKELDERRYRALRSLLTFSGSLASTTFRVAPEAIAPG